MVSDFQRGNPQQHIDDNNVSEYSPRQLFVVSEHPRRWVEFGIRPKPASGKPNDPERNLPGDYVRFAVSSNFRGEPVGIGINFPSRFKLVQRGLLGEYFRVAQLGLRLLRLGRFVGVDAELLDLHVDHPHGRG